MHATYSFDALVIAGAPVGESDKRYCFLSEELGVVWARAKSVRKEESKLRYALSDYTQTQVSLVRGRYGFRVVGAVHKADIPQGAQCAVFARLARLVQRVTLPDVDARVLYAPLLHAHQALQQPHAASDDIELLTALRILARLGYVAPRGEYERVLEQNDCSDETLALVGGRRSLVLSDINTALSESQL